MTGGREQDSLRLTSLFGIVGRWAVAFVVAASIGGYAGRGTVSGATATIVPIALAVLVFVVGSSTPLPDRSSAARVGRVSILAIVVPAALLPVIGWVASHLVEPTVADGVLALGLAPAEIASVATVSLAGGDSALAATTLAGSILLTTAVGPLVLRVLTGTSVSTGSLVVALVGEVVAPFAAGVLAGPFLRPRVPGEMFDGISVLVVSALAGLTASQLPGIGEIPSLTLAAGIVVVGGYVIGAVIGRPLRPMEQVSVLLTSGMRDFAVAAALATAAFGATASAAAAPFGVLVLVSGTAIAAREARRGPRRSCRRGGT